MKNCIYAVIVISFSSSVAYSKQYLAIIDDIDVRNSNNLCIIEQVRSHSITILDEKEYEIIKNSRYSCSIVDENPFGKIYYLVYPVDITKADIHNIAPVLADFNDCFLVRVSKENRELLLDLRAEFRLVELEPMIFNSTVPPELLNISERMAHNQGIQDIVDKVNHDTVVANIMWLQNVGSRHVSYKYMAEKVVPWTVAKLKAYGCDSVFTHTVPGYNAPNVVGVKLGSKYPSYKKYYILGGHLDNMPKTDPNKGADDNATGVASFLETARALKDYTLDYTIFFMGFNVEELGDIGSGAYAKDAKTKGDSIIGMICAEMCGHTPAGKPENIVVTDKKSMPASTKLAKAWMKAAQTYAQQLTVLDPTEVTNSDHASFWRQGYTAIKLREHIRCDVVYHTVNDYFNNPIGLNNPKQVTRTTKTNVALLCEVAKINLTTSIAGKSFTTGLENRVNLYISGAKKKISIPTAIGEYDNFSIFLYSSDGQCQGKTGSLSYSKSMQPVVLNSLNETHSQPAKGIYFIIIITDKKREVARTLIIQ